MEFIKAGLKYEIYGNKAHLVGFDSNHQQTSSELWIPSTVGNKNEYEVEVIKDKALENTKYRKITLPATLCKIGAGAFKNSDVEEISFFLPVNVTRPKVLTIEAGAFQSCIYLRKFETPQFLDIKDHAFAQCYHLEIGPYTGFYIKNLQSCAFWDCYNVSHLSFTDNAILEDCCLQGSSVVELAFEDIARISQEVLAEIDRRHIKVRALMDSPILELEYCGFETEEILPF